MSTDVKEIRSEVKPIAKTFINKISLYANNRYSDGARMTGAIAIAVMERTIVSLANKLHKDDPDEGRKFIETVYAAALKDALEEWTNLP